MKLSIIIPLYNNAKFISDCINSCLNQNVNDDTYEIIVVNDGSTDGGEKIIQEKFKNRNLILVNQENKGLSEARNKGLSIASGEYVWFVDSDDWIECNSFVSLFNIFNASSPNIIRFCARNVNQEKTKFYSVRNNNIEPNTNGYFEDGLRLVSNPNFVVCATFNVIKKKYLDDNKLYFYPNIIHEDIEFSPRLYLNESKVYMIYKVFYNVRLAENSITRSYKYKRSDDLFFIAIRLDNYFKLNEIEKYSHFITRCINSALRNFSLMDKSLRSDNLNDLYTALHISEYLFYHYKKTNRIKDLLLYYCLKYVPLHIIIYLFSLKKR